MIHIGFDKNTIELIKEYLKQRKQYVEVNSVSSDILVVGDRSVQQGSVLSTLYYTIFMLDLPRITHQVLHNNHFEEFNCTKEFMITFIDDVFAVIEGDRNDIWFKIEKYIRKMESYYISNKLKINVAKTQILISGPNNTTVMGGIILDNELIRNSRKIKILGTYFSANCRFNDNLLEGSNSLLTQIKRRSHAIKRIAKYFPLHFKIQLVNAILYGKLRYNLATWGNLSKTSMKKVNNVILQTVKIVTRDIYFGKETK